MKNRTKKNIGKRKFSRKFRGGTKTINDIQNFIRGKINEYRNSGNEKAYVYEDVYDEILSFINKDETPVKKETITRPITPKQSSDIKGYNSRTGLPVYEQEINHTDLVLKPSTHNGYWTPGY